MLGVSHGLPRMLCPDQYPYAGFKQAQANMIPFGSSSARKSEFVKDVKHAGRGNLSPGPGAYETAAVTGMRANPGPSRGRQAFSARTARFGAKAQDTPGPGSYHDEVARSSFAKPSSRAANFGHHGGGKGGAQEGLPTDSTTIKWVRVPTAPSVPAKNQLTGWTEDPLTGKLVREKPPSDQHGGAGPAPGSYNSQYSRTAIGTGPTSASFGRDTSRRSDFTKTGGVSGTSGTAAEVGAYDTSNRDAFKPLGKTNGSASRAAARRSTTAGTKRGPPPGAASAGGVAVGSASVRVVGNSGPSAGSVFQSSSPRMSGAVAAVGGDGAPGPGAYLGAADNGAAITGQRGLTAGYGGAAGARTFAVGGGASHGADAVSSFTRATRNIHDPSHQNFGSTSQRFATPADGSNGTNMPGPGMYYKPIQYAGPPQRGDGSDRPGRVQSASGHARGAVPSKGAGVPAPSALSKRKNTSDAAPGRWGSSAEIGSAASVAGGASVGSNLMEKHLGEGGAATARGSRPPSQGGGAPVGRRGFASGQRRWTEAKADEVPGPGAYPEAVRQSGSIRLRGGGVSMSADVVTAARAEVAAAGGGLASAVPALDLSGVLGDDAHEGALPIPSAVSSMLGGEPAAPFGSSTGRFYDASTRKGPARSKAFSARAAGKALSGNKGATSARGAVSPARVRYGMTGSSRNRAPVGLGATAPAGIQLGNSTARKGTAAPWAKMLQDVESIGGGSARGRRGASPIRSSRRVFAGETRTDDDGLPPPGQYFNPQPVLAPSSEQERRKASGVFNSHTPRFKAGLNAQAKRGGTQGAPAVQTAPTFSKGSVLPQAQSRSGARGALPGVTANSVTADHRLSSSRDERDALLDREATDSTPAPGTYRPENSTKWMRQTHSSHGGGLLDVGPRDRFATPWSKMQAPGPGEYSSHNDRRSMARSLPVHRPSASRKRVMSSTALRFGDQSGGKAAPVLGAASDLGPGSYDSGLQWTRRTFNITVAEQEMIAAAQSAI